MDNKNATKRATSCKFFLQMKVSNLEFAQKYRKIEFLEGKSSFKGQKSTVGFFFGKIEFPSKRTKKPANMRMKDSMSDNTC